MVPERNNYWLLDSAFGWPIATRDGISITAGDGDITLDPLPGRATFFDGSPAASIACPVALAADFRRRIFVVDGVNNQVTILSLGSSTAKPIAAFGGRGRGSREFENPRSLTVLRSGAVAVADTGNRRVLLFSGPPHALLHVWGGPDVAMKPNAVASDHCGIVYIADGQSRSILRARASGEWLDPIGAGVLTNPIEVAVSNNQTLAVVDGNSSQTSILVFPPDGGKHVTLSLIASPRSLTFDDSGNLYAGTANAIVAKLEQDDTELSGWSLAGEGVSDVDGQITKLTWVKGTGLVGILSSTERGTAPRLFSMDPAGAYRLEGSFALKRLDSRIENCSWHRVRIVGTVSEGASITIVGSTSEDKNKTGTPAVTSALLSGENPDCLIQSPPGRYLTLSLKLQSNGSVTPRIHAIEVHFPRRSYLEYLPAVFQDDDQSRLFLDRFLSIFQTTFDDMDSLLDNLADFFDPLMTPAKMLPWLAAWVAMPMDPTMPADRQRRLLKQAFEAYVTRGTVDGLKKVIQDYTGIDQIRILEHYRLRNWLWLQSPGRTDGGIRLWSRNFCARLKLGVSSTVGSFTLTNTPPPAAEPLDWGANQFSVFFPANPYTVADSAAAIQKVVDREKPAHTQAILSPVFPRLRVGVQATLDVDAYLGKANSMILGKLATLNYDSVLTRSPADRDLEALGLSRYPRLGEDARIL